MNKKIIDTLFIIENKIIRGEDLNKKEKELLKALIHCALIDLGGIKDDNNGTGGTQEI